MAAAVVAAAAKESAGGAPKEIPELVLKGIEEFNKGEFYECHEHLEEAWMQEPRRVRFLYQGILQVGVGFYHQQNGNWRGATGLIRNGTARLREFEPVTLGIDVAKLVRECERCLQELEDLGREQVREFDQSMVPKVKWACWRLIPLSPGILRCCTVAVSREILRAEACLDSEQALFLIREARRCAARFQSSQNSCKC